jgi:sugar O-acyltransferase (sialic acid O-acetyltransferase NeuD family)
MGIVIMGGRKDAHARVVADAIIAGGKEKLLGFIDDNPELKGEKILGYEILGTSSTFDSIREQVTGVIIAIGDNHVRKRIANELREDGFTLTTVIHPTAIIANDVQIGPGTFIAAGTVVNSGTTIGEGVIINTGATIDHDNNINNYVHIAPGVHTAGRVTVGKCAFMGIGSRAIPDRIIGENAIVGAGAVVIEDIPDNATAVGVPAKVIKMHGEENNG